MIDPVDRIVRLVITQIGRTPMDDVAKGYTIERVTDACRGGIISEFKSWSKAMREITYLEECSQCQELGMGPSHDGSKSCESGSIASGGKNSHCSCDVCF